MATRTPTPRVAGQRVVLELAINVPEDGSLKTIKQSVGALINSKLEHCNPKLGKLLGTRQMRRGKAAPVTAARTRRSRKDPISYMTEANGSSDTRRRRASASA